MLSHAYVTFAALLGTILENGVFDCQRPKPKGKGLHFQVSSHLHPGGTRQRPDGRTAGILQQSTIGSGYPLGAGCQISTARLAFTWERIILPTTSKLKLFRCEAGSLVYRESASCIEQLYHMCSFYAIEWAKAEDFIPRLEARGPEGTLRP
jgi:hypothetical protein